MTTTKVTRVSWFDRLRNSVLGIGAGFVLIGGMIGLLWWNEGRAVQTQRSLSEGSELVVSVPAGAVDPANDRQLVHVSGELSSQEMLSDSTFLVAAPGVRLIRSVEMYQWIESSTTQRQQNLGGSETRTTSYSYAPGWSAQHQDSSRFQDSASHHNPPMIHSGSTIRLDSAGLDAFRVERNVLDRVGGAERLELPASFAAALQEQLQTPVSVTNGSYYLGTDPLQPVIGDYRISFEVVPLTTISVVGAQQGDTVAPYATSAGDSLLLVRNGTVQAQKMFEAAASSNAALGWALRALGVMLLITGFSMLLKPLSVLASVVPFLGRIVGMGTGLVGAMFGVATAALTIGAAWLAFRPVTAIIIFAAGAAVIVLLRLRGRKRNTAPAADAAVA